MTKQQIIERLEAGETIVAIGQFDAACTRWLRKMTKAGLLIEEMSYRFPNPKRSWVKA